MSNVLVIAQTNGGALNPSTRKAVTCAKEVGEVTVAVFAADGAAAAAEAAGIDGVAKVLQIDNAANENPTAAALAPQIVATAEGFTHVFGPNTTFGKDLMPRVAALLGVPMVTDVMKVNGAMDFDRPIYAGNAIASVSVPAGTTVVASVRCASYKAAEDGGSAAVEAATAAADLPSHTRFEGLESGGDGGRPDLQSAAKVVSGGRGVGSEENFSVIFSLADKMGAGAGASRAAVDSGFVPNDMQVGQTGKIIAPDLYMAFGISGAIQHLTGIKDAGTIVAVNKDPDAPIFEVADLGLVGDLFEIIPQIEAAL